MGEAARRKLFDAARIIKFDFSAPDYTIGHGDAKTFGPDGVQAKITRILMVSSVGAKFPNGCTRKDGKLWAAWQEIITSEEEDQVLEDVVEIPKAQFDWMKKIICDEELSIQVSLSQWREALVDYMMDIAESEKEEMKKEMLENA